MTKSADVEVLLEALRRIASGRRYVSPIVAEQLVNLVATGVQSAADRPHVRLSNREMDVFSRLARGEATGTIAAKLGLSPKTVSTYRARVLEKLGVKTNADLTRYAIRHGLMPN